MLDFQHSNLVPQTITDAPPKIGKWPAHDGGIVSVQFVSHETGQFIVSGSTDGSVKLWSLHGALVGNLGQVCICSEPNSLICRPFLCLVYFLS